MHFHRFNICLDPDVVRELDRLVPSKLRSEVIRATLLLLVKGLRRRGTKMTLDLLMGQESENAYLEVKYDEPKRSDKGDSEPER